MLVAFSVTPLGVGEGVAEYVADAVRVTGAVGGNAGSLHEPRRRRQRRGSGH